MDGCSYDPRTGLYVNVTGTPKIPQSRRMDLGWLEEEIRRRERERTEAAQPRQTECAECHRPSEKLSKSKGLCPACVQKRVREGRARSLETRRRRRIRQFGINETFVILYT